MLSRAKPAVGGTPPPGDRRRKKGKKVPQLEELLALRDFTGAIALLEVTAAVRTETPAQGRRRAHAALGRAAPSWPGCAQHSCGARGARPRVPTRRPAPLGLTVSGSPSHGRAAFGTWEGFLLLPSGL